MEHAGLARLTVRIDQSANAPQHVRAGGEFFAAPAAGPHTRYEALRAYLYDGEPAAAVAERFGYTLAGLHSAVADFRGGARYFFLDARPGPKTAPGKDAARTRIIALRAQGYSIDEIGAVLAEEGIGLNRTGISEVITDAGLPRIWRRPDAERGGPRRDKLARARALDGDDLAALPASARTRMAGLLLVLPDLLALDLPAMVATAGYPGTRDIPPVSYLLSLLALKLTGTRRVSHVPDLAADPAAALFAGLTALPKTTALTTYSYRLQHTKQQKFLAALDKATAAAGLATGEVLNLDFHAVMHWGEDAALDKHYVPARVVKAKCAPFLARGKPARQVPMIREDDYTIVASYGARYRGIVQYYLLAGDVHRLHRLRWVMETSMLKTLASKHRSSVSKMARRFKAKTDTPHGLRTCFEARFERDGRPALVARFGGIALRRQKLAVLTDREPIRTYPNKELISRLLINRCELCGQPEWVVFMATKRCKTLVVCGTCHDQIHHRRPTNTLAS